MGALESHAPGAVPSTIRDHFRFVKDDPRGDSDHYHLYCYYRTSGPQWSEGKFHTEWSVADTENATAPDPEALARERYDVNVELFEKQIVEELRRENACLLEQGGKLINKPAMPRIP